jgi:hypothetical protein
MLKSGARAFLTIFLVVAMAGTAVAFAVGVNFSPKKTVCVNPIAGSSYQICINVPTPNLGAGIKLTGLKLNKIKTGKLNFTFKNANTVPVKIKFVLVVKTKAHKTKRFNKTVVVPAGKNFAFKRNLKKTRVKAAKLTLTITDTQGDRAVIKKTLGRFGR